MAKVADPADDKSRDVDTPWRIKGDWWDLCNCAIGCPCIFGSEPDPRPGADPRAIRASRGGVWKGSMRHSRLAARHRFEPTTWRSEIGFRGAWRPERPGS